MRKRYEAAAHVVPRRCIIVYVCILYIYYVCVCVCRRGKGEGERGGVTLHITCESMRASKDCKSSCTSNTADPKVSLLTTTVYFVSFLAGSDAALGRKTVPLPTLYSSCDGIAFVKAGKKIVSAKHRQRRRDGGTRAKVVVYLVI